MLAVAIIHTLGACLFLSVSIGELVEGVRISHPGILPSIERQLNINALKKVQTSSSDLQAQMLVSRQ